jgi:hypothetical protein
VVACADYGARCHVPRTMCHVPHAVCHAPTVAAGIATATLSIISILSLLPLVAQAATSFPLCHRNHKRQLRLLILLPSRRMALSLLALPLHGPLDVARRPRAPLAPGARVEKEGKAAPLPPCGLSQLPWIAEECSAAPHTSGCTTPHAPPPHCHPSFPHTPPPASITAGCGSATATVSVRVSGGATTDAICGAWPRRHHGPCPAWTATCPCPCPLTLTLTLTYPVTWTLTCPWTLTAQIPDPCCGCCRDAADHGLCHGHCHGPCHGRGRRGHGHGRGLCRGYGFGHGHDHGHHGYDRVRSTWSATWSGATIGREASETSIANASMPVASQHHRHRHRQQLRRRQGWACRAAIQCPHR